MRSRLVRAWAVGFGLLATATVGLAAEGGWEPLFNGKDLEGWTCGAKDKFSVEDGCIVGTQSDGKGDDLYTTKEYANFELRVAYRVVWPANSGIWFRTNAGNGYQFDILKYANPVAYSGTLYCPGKLFIFRDFFKRFRHYHILLRACPPKGNAVILIAGT